MTIWRMPSKVTSGPVSAVSSSPQTVAFSGARGITLVADEWNRGATAADRPTILMLHGGGQNRFSWKNTGQILADEGHHVVALDTRGHGDSDRAPGADYAVETLTADVLHVVAAIGRRVVVVGASMGGLTGILVAERAGPQTVNGLVLVDVVPRYEKEGSARIRDFMLGNIDGFGSLEEAADAVAEYLPHRDKPRSPEGPAAAHRELRTGCHRPDDPGPVDSRKAVRRGQFRRCPGFPGQGAQRGVRGIVQRGAHRRRQRQRRVHRRRGGVRQTT